MHQTMSWGEIADKYNVTANIVRKWRKNMVCQKNKRLLSQNTDMVP